jgi:phosphatidate cytidylyltransferase
VDIASIAWRAFLCWLLLPAIGIPLSILAERSGHRGFRDRLSMWFVIVPVTLGSSYAGPWPFFALVTGCSVLACWELARLGGTGRGRTARFTVALLLSWPWPALAQGGVVVPLWLLVSLAVLAPFVYLLVRGAGSPWWAQAGLALALGACLSCWVLLERRPLGFRFVVFAFTVVVVNDLVGFVSGRLLGGYRPFPTVSPNKTLAGYVGGGLGGIAIGHVMSFAIPELGPSDLTLAGLLLVTTGSAGDLVASAIKRRHAVKDFGRVLGAHGGILDRLDSLLGSALVFCLYLRVVLP